MNARNDNTKDQDIDALLAESNRQANGDDAIAAYYTATALVEKNPAKAEYYAKLALHLSKNSENRDICRAAAHNLLASILKQKFGTKIQYSEYLDIISHVRLAIAYRDSETYQKNLQLLLEPLDEKTARQLISDSEVLQLKNGCYKTMYDFLSHPNLGKEGADAWAEYQHPDTAPLEKKTGLLGLMGLLARANSTSKDEQMHSKHTLKP